jgi:feruloyl-CoA synthase
MPLVKVPGMRPVNMGELAVDLETTAEGIHYVRSKLLLGDYPRSLIDRLDAWAAEAPERVLFADRGPDGEWRKVSYSHAARLAGAIGLFLIETGVRA